MRELTRRLVDRPLAADLTPEDLRAVWTAPLCRLTEWLARSADCGFDARPAVRTGVLLAVVPRGAQVPEHNTRRLMFSPVGSCTRGNETEPHDPISGADCDRRRACALRRLRRERAESRLRTCGNVPAAMCRERNSTGSAREEVAVFVASATGSGLWCGPASTAHSSLASARSSAGRPRRLTVHPLPPVARHDNEEGPGQDGPLFVECGAVSYAATRTRSL